jgi:6-phosphofructokinase 1
VLTGGGDCPGLNAAIRAIVRRADGAHNITTIGLANGWQGVLEGSVKVLDVTSTRGLLYRGGTILGTSRLNPVDVERGPERIRETLDVHGIDGLIVIGGEGTLSAATRLSADFDIPIVGIPKTIDNDLMGTDITFGYDTAVNIVMEALDRIHTTAFSHERCLVVEIMGRHAGWITWAAGLAGGAHIILLPEEPFDMDEVAAVVRRRNRQAARYTVIAAAEGARPKGDDDLVMQTNEKDEFGNVRLGGIGQRLAKKIEEMTGTESRHVVLGHLQRGGAPSAFDRVLGTRLGVAAADLAEAGTFGKMLSVQGQAIKPTPLSKVTKGYRTVPKDLQRMAFILRGE